METFDLWFGRVANGFTVLAALIAIAGVLWAVLGRAKLSVQIRSSGGPEPSLSLFLISIGSSPILNLQVGGGSLLRDGRSSHGGDFVNLAELNIERGFVLEVFDPSQTKFNSDPRENEFRFEIRPGEAAYVRISWKSPLFAWRRASQTYVWTPTDRYSGEGPRLLRGRREREFVSGIQRAWVEENVSATDGTSPPKAIPAADETFDGLLAASLFPSVVGFGASWQGELWESTNHLLDAFADKNSSRCQVLIVDVAAAPRLVDRFGLSTFPTFRTFIDGKQVASHDGLSSYRDVEKSFLEALHR